MGWSAGKVDDVTACRAVQDGGYALPLLRYDNNKMAAICYYVLHLQQYIHRLNLLYILFRYSKCWVGTQNPRCNGYFLCKAPDTNFEIPIQTQLSPTLSKFQHNAALQSKPSAQMFHFFLLLRISIIYFTSPYHRHFSMLCLDCTLSLPDGRAIIADGPGRPLRFAAQRQPLCWNFMYHSWIVLSVGGSVRYMVRNLRCTVTIDSVLANAKTQNAFLFTVHAIFRHDYPLAVEPASTPRPLVQKKLWDMLYLLICSFLPCLSWLLRSRVRKFRRDLWITLYFQKQELNACC